MEEYIKNGINKDIIKEEFEKVAELLNRLHDDNTLSDIEILDIQEMIVGILEKLLEGSRDREGIGELMTGTAFRTEVTDALYKGLSQGISQGFGQGLNQSIQIMDCIRNNPQEEDEVIAKKCGVETSVVTMIRNKMN